MHGRCVHGFVLPLLQKDTDMQNYVPAHIPISVTEIWLVDLACARHSLLLAKGKNTFTTNGMRQRGAVSSSISRYWDWVWIITRTVAHGPPWDLWGIERFGQDTGCKDLGGHYSLTHNPHLSPKGHFGTKMCASCTPISSEKPKRPGGPRMRQREDEKRNLGRRDCVRKIKTYSTHETSWGLWRMNG